LPFLAKVPAFGDFISPLLWSPELHSEFFHIKHMVSSQLPNYLRAHRKRLALSQKDVAYLLGAGRGDKVSRHETFVRDPNIEAILAYELIFQKPASELFAGLRQTIQREIALRAKTLAAKTDCRRIDQQATRRLQTLADLADSRSKTSKHDDK
jgi:hypothetical protein